MSDDDTKRELAELKAKSAAQDAKIAELEAKVDPPKSTFVPMSDEEWRDQMHQAAERRMSMAMPPSVHQYFADGVTAADCADIARIARAPTGPTSGVPGAQQATGGSGPQPSSTPGWSEPRPLGPPAGVAQADRLMDVQDAKDRAELIEREARFKAMEKLAEQK
jgi:hypothetical protein